METQEDCNLQILWIKWFSFNESVHFSFCLLHSSPHLFPSSSLKTCECKILQWLFLKFHSCCEMRVKAIFLLSLMLSLLHQMIIACFLSSVKKKKLPASIPPLFRKKINLTPESDAGPQAKYQLYIYLMTKQHQASLFVSYDKGSSAEHLQSPDRWKWHRWHFLFLQNPTGTPPDLQPF